MSKLRDRSFYEVAASGSPRMGKAMRKMAFKGGGGASPIIREKGELREIFK